MVRRVIGSGVFRFLPPEARTIVERAQRHGLPGSQPPPAYLAPDLCTVLSLLLVVPTLGYSLLLMPLVWVGQHERTNRRLERLRLQLEQFDEAVCPDRGPIPRIHSGEEEDHSPPRPWRNVPPGLCSRG
jgi:hypothetical protein